MQLILGKSLTGSESELGRNQMYKSGAYETVGEVSERETSCISRYKTPIIYSSPIFKLAFRGLRIKTWQVEKET